MDKEKEQYGHQKLQAVISVGATLLGALLGRKAVSRSSLGKATTAMRGASRAAREKEDIGRAAETVEALQVTLSDLEEEFQADTDALEAAVDPTSFDLA